MSEDVVRYAVGKNEATGLFYPLLWGKRLWIAYCWIPGGSRSKRFSVCPPVIRAMEGDEAEVRMCLNQDRDVGKWLRDKLSDKTFLCLWYETKEGAERFVNDRIVIDYWRTWEEKAGYRVSLEALETPILCRVLRRERNRELRRERDREFPPSDRKVNKYGEPCGPTVADLTASINEYYQQDIDDQRPFRIEDAIYGRFGETSGVELDFEREPRRRGVGWAGSRGSHLGAVLRAERKEARHQAKLIENYHWELEAEEEVAADLGKDPAIRVEIERGITMDYQVLVRDEGGDSAD